jgi:hypothetical protein
MRYLREDTTANVAIGPIIKSTDGYTPYTGLTSDDIDINFYQGTGVTTQDFDANNSLSEIGNGIYNLGVNSSNTKAAGPLRADILVNNDSGIPIFEDFQVINQHIYDSLFASSGTERMQVDVLEMAAVAVTTDAADNFDNFFFDNDAQSTRRLSELCNTGDLFTTGSIVEANMVAMSSATLTSVAGDNFSTFYDNAGVASTVVVTEVTVTGDLNDLSTFTTGDIVEANIVSISSQAITTQTGANIEGYFAAGATVDRTVNDVSTFSTADIVEANMVAMSSQSLTTQAGANFENYFQDGGAVSTEVVGDAVTTADLFTTADIVEANMVSMSSQALTTQTGANFETFFQDGGAVSTEVVGDLVTTEDILTTNEAVGTGTVYDVWTHGDLMKLLQAHLLGNTTYDGTTYMLYDHGGTSFVKFDVDTGYRTRTT